MKLQGGEWSTVLFKYEQLGVFCFLCGLLGHSKHFCDLRFTMENDDSSRGGKWR